jgi:hypothetical protein
MWLRATRSDLRRQVIDARKSWTGLASFDNNSHDDPLRNAARFRELARAVAARAPVG